MRTCATASSDHDEPLAGTAATARTWLLLEQSGPWGAKALTTSRLDPEVGRRLERAAEGTGTRVALIRRPGPHADTGTAKPRRVFVAHTVPGAAWLRTTELDDPRTLLDLDLAALAAGDRRALDLALPGTEERTAPLALVCTNGKRDRCCAVLGRPLASELAASGEETWEITHLGGHRFSPTLLILPHGYAYGRMAAHQVKDVLVSAAEGRVAGERCRGLSAWDRPGQAAELAVRRAVDEWQAGTIRITHSDGSAPLWTVGVAHVDGRRWTVVVARGASLPTRPESCGAEPAAPARMDVVSVREAAGGAGRGR